MIVCHCHVVSDRDIDGAIEAGGHDECALAAICGAGSTCGGCLPVVRELLARRGLQADEALTARHIRRRLGGAVPRARSLV